MNPFPNFVKLSKNKYSIWQRRLSTMNITTRRMSDITSVLQIFQTVLPNSKIFVHFCTQRLNSFDNFVQDRFSVAEAFEYNVTDEGIGNFFILLLRFLGRIFIILGLQNLILAEQSNLLERSKLARSF